jgi:hypothetical protein
MTSLLGSITAKKVTGRVHRARTTVAPRLCTTLVTADELDVGNAVVLGDVVRTVDR